MFFLLPGAACTLTPSCAFADDAGGANNVVQLSESQDPTPNVSSGNYYTQIDLTTGQFNIPSDDKGQTTFGRALLKAFGLGNKTKSLTISVTLTGPGSPLPEVPLVTYAFNGKGTVTNLNTVDEYISPRWQLGTSDTITTTLNYKFSEQSTYDPKLITSNITAIIPSSSLVSTISGPFAAGIVNLAASAFSIQGTRSVTVGKAATLTPYSGGPGHSSAVFTISLPNGQVIGTVVAKIYVSSTLARGTTLATGVQLNDLVWKAGEGAENLSLTIGGTKSLIRN